MLSAILLLWPVLAALLVLMLKGETARKVAFGAALVEFGIAMVTLAGFDPNGGLQHAVSMPWLAEAGIHFSIGIDGITMLMVLLTVFLVPLIILASFNHPYRNPSAFYALILFMQTGLLGVFMAMDGFVFYLFWELALIPIYFIAGIWGGERRIAVTFKFFIYTIFGSLFMLVALVYLYFQTPGTHSSAIADLYNVSLSMFDQRWVFWFLFIAFAIKMPVFPFHTWQPDTYVDSPAPATMLLSGIMLKMGIYGVIRWLLPIVPAGAEAYAPVIMVLSIIGIVYASIIAIRQRDMKRLLAYSSIAHVGLISAGLFTFTIQGLQGSMIQSLSHGINVVGLFFIIDIIFKRTQTRQLDQLGGITQTTP
ncbi:MAG: NADH-quinone oxidoreductase subunit M, partial [Sphingobacteriales bacterium]